MSNEEKDYMPLVELYARLAVLAVGEPEENYLHMAATMISEVVFQYGGTKALNNDMKRVGADEVLRRVRLASLPERKAILRELLGYTQPIYRWIPALQAVLKD